MTKEQAIELWYRFIESSRVIKDECTVGMTYTYYELNLKYYGKTIAWIRLLSTPVFSGHSNSVPEESTYQTLETEYGKFNLTPQECFYMRTSWFNRDKQKGIIPINEVEKLL